jgi:uncharacterized membrane protein
MMAMDDTVLRDFVHERFRRTDEKLDRVLEMLGMIVQRLGSLETQGAQMRADLVRVEHRLDGFEARLARIEKRLELQDAPA